MTFHTRLARTLLSAFAVVCFGLGVFLLLTPGVDRQTDPRPQPNPKECTSCVSI